jgi:hypothetical protein
MTLEIKDELSLRFRGARVLSASATRSGEGIQVRIRIPVGLPLTFMGTKTTDVLKERTVLRCSYMRTDSFVNVNWSALPKNRKNEHAASLYYMFGSSIHLPPYINYIENKDLFELAKNVYEAALTVYRKGSLKRIQQNHKLTRARKTIKENLLWALREGLSEKEIRKLLKEACCADLLTS